MKTWFRSCFVVALASATLLSGCTFGPATCEVSGKVTLDDKPLPEGEISLVSEDNTVPSVSAPIRDGTFQLSVKAGKKIVRIYARQPVPGTNPPMFNESLPGQYNAESKLTADVTSGGENRFTFELKSNPAKK